MSGLEELLRGRVAYGVMIATLRHLTQQLKTNGEPIPVWAKPVLEALSVAAGVPLSPAVMSVVGRPVERMDSSPMVTVKVAALQVHRTERHVRRLCSEGRVIARRLGERTWLVDVTSIQNVIGRSNG